MGLLGKLYIAILKFLLYKSFFFHLGLIILQSLKFVQSYRQTVEILYLRLCESNYLQLKKFMSQKYIATEIPMPK